jgi:hypothetical protein
VVMRSVQFGAKATVTGKNTGQVAV